MRKIIVGAMVSMDGVMQAPGGPTEDPTKGFRFGGSEYPTLDCAVDILCLTARSGVNPGASAPYSRAQTSFPNFHMKVRFG